MHVRVVCTCAYACACACAYACACVRAVRIRERRACGRADEVAASAARLMRMRSVRASRHSPE